MSLSFGEIVQFLELANGLRERFVDAPVEFQALSSDYVSYFIQTTLAHLW
jgi:hypothetical protein